ncbi:uncharacterized protein LOC105696783 [Orussus abietinus]|uniref:uncharacterized protein LOC105696783 n=1 Tax=Orussus abietinus TaxID=222816 RepID=UPI000626E6F5|nr:uncharacterized protein LOC105696783 [Orussus abietinus]
MADIRLLEERVEALERQIYGLDKTPTLEEFPSTTPIVDSVFHTNTVILSALSGREKANAMVKRLSELNSYLDPDCEEISLQTDAKLELILAMEYEIKENVCLLEKLQELLPALETDRIRDLPELNDKLNTLTLLYLKEYEKTEAINDKIRDFIAKYNAIIRSIALAFFKADATLTALEVAAAPKKQLD